MSSLTNHFRESKQLRGGHVQLFKNEGRTKEIVFYRNRGE